MLAWGTASLRASDLNPYIIPKPHTTTMVFAYGATNARQTLSGATRGWLASKMQQAYSSNLASDGSMPICTYLRSHQKRSPA